MDMAKPKIRFKGYTDEWEQRKLSEFSEKTFGGGTPKTSNESFWKGNIPWIQSSDLIEGSLFDVEPRKYISQEAVDKSATKLVPENSVAIVTRVGVGKLAFMPFSYATSQDFLSLSVLKTEPQFTVYALYKKLQLELNTVQGTSIKGVTKDELLTKEIMIPCYEEQEKIGSYLHSLDRLITLHQRKCEQAKKLKKYMLQKMFPQNGQKVPEIRFKGFTDDWEQRKLGDVIDDMYNGQTPSRNKSEYWNGTIKWLSSGELNRGTVYDSIETITEEGQKAANLKIVPKGTFVMAITGLEAAGTRGNCALLGFDTTLNQSCMALFPKQEMLTSEFLFQWYRKVGEEYGINYTQGTKQQSYNAELIKILPISLPSVVEQRKISSYLSQLDHLITLHQQKCDELKNIKKFMLQNMFI